VKEKGNNPCSFFDVNTTSKDDEIIKSMDYICNSDNKQEIEAWSEWSPIIIYFFCFENNFILKYIIIFLIRNYFVLFNFVILMDLKNYIYVIIIL